MWVLVDGDRTQVVTTLGAREGVFVEVSEDRPWWAVKQERNAKGEIVTRSVELTEELRRIVENARIFNDGTGNFVGRIIDPTEPTPPLSRDYPPPLGIRLVEQSGVTPRLSGDAGSSWTHADGAAVNPVAAKILDGVAGKLAMTPDEQLQVAWHEMEVSKLPAMPDGFRIAGLQKLRDRVAAALADPQPISKDAALALLDCAIAAERTATYMEERRADGARQTDAFAAGRARAEAAELERLRAENAQLREAISGYAGQVVALADEERGRYRIHSMDRKPPEDGVYVVWQKWPAETPLAGVAPTLRSFAGGRWSARGGSDAGWSFVPKGVL